MLLESTKQKMHGLLACEPLVVHESTDAVHLDIPSKDDIAGGASVLHTPSTAHHAAAAAESVLCRCAGLCVSCRIDGPKTSRSRSTGLQRVGGALDSQQCVHVCPLILSVAGRRKGEL